MTTTGYTPYQPAMAPFAPAGLPAAALAGVRSRRVVAVCLDLVVVSILSLALWTALMVLTFGLSLLTCRRFSRSWRFSTTGSASPAGGWRHRACAPPISRCGWPGAGPLSPFLIAAVHAVLFYVSWMFPPVFLVALVTSDKRCLHDILSGVIFVRRPGGI